MGIVEGTELGQALWKAKPAGSHCEQMFYHWAPNISFKNTFNNIFKDGRGSIGLQSHYSEVEAGESEVRGQPELQRAPGHPGL